MILFIYLFLSVVAEERCSHCRCRIGKENTKGRAKENCRGERNHDQEL